MDGLVDGQRGGEEENQEVVQLQGFADGQDVGMDGADREVVQQGGLADGGGEEEVVHEGGCHCGAVSWRVRAAPLPTGCSCNNFFEREL